MMLLSEAPSRSMRLNAVRHLAAMAQALTLAVCCCVLSSCAALVPKLEPPQLTVTGVALQGGNSLTQQMRVTLHVINPNDREIAIRGIDCRLDVDTQPFAEGSTEAAFVLPAKGETDFNLNVTAHLDNALGLLTGSLMHSSVDYRLYGQVHLGAGIVRTLPFDQKGRLRL
jgi:LEA14-like dessication related protein